MGLGPELGGLSTVVNGLSKGAQILGKSSRLTDIGSYRGNSNQVQNNILERAKDIHQDLKNYPSFA